MGLTRWRGQGCCPVLCPDPELAMARGMGCHWHFPWEIPFTGCWASTLWTCSGDWRASCTARSLATERIGCHSRVPSLLPGLSLHVSEKCKRSIARDAPEKASTFYPFMEKANKKQSIAKARGNSSGMSKKEIALCLPFFFTAKISRCQVFPLVRKSGVIALPSAAIPGFSTSSP